MSVFYNDVAMSFSPHYFEYLSKGVDALSPFYADDCKLVVDGKKAEGKAAVLAAIKDLDITSLAPSADFLAHPYQNDQILITVHPKKGEAMYVITFVLKEVGENHRFGITSQLIHIVPKSQ